MSQYRNEESSNRQAASDEIDLREVFASMGRFFASVGGGIINLILAIRRATIKFAVLILAFVISGAVFGFIHHQNNEGYYRAQMAIDSRFYTYELLESILNNLNEQARKGANHVLAKELNLAVEQAAKIRGLEIQPLLPIEEKVNLLSYLNRIQENGKPFEEEQLDSLRDRLLLNASQYIITAEIYDNGILEDLQNGLVVYLSSKDYVAKRVAVERENLEMLKRSIEEDERSLAKLKGEIARGLSENPINFRTGSNTVILGAEKDAGPNNIYQQSFELYAQKAKINRNLLLSQEVEVVSGFSSTETPANLSLIDNIFLWGLIGLSLAYIVLILIYVNRCLKKFEQRRRPI